jgi:hypothetical protein
MLDFGDVMDEFIFSDFDDNLEDFNFIMNIIDDKTYEIIFDYENATYGLVTKFFVIMERVLGGCTLNHVIFDRKKQKIIVEDEWHNLQKRKEWFKKAYIKIKECFIVDKEELEGLIYGIDEIE